MKLQSPDNIVNSKSVKGYIWREKEVDENLIKEIKQHYQLPYETAKLLAGRQSDMEKVEYYLDNSLRTHLPDPFHLKDMTKAAEYIVKAVEGKKNIWVFGDYDVDGATSSSLLYRFFEKLGVVINIYIPDRIAEGYGPNTQALKSLKAKGADLVITVDCGTSAFEPLEAANQMGLDVIVVDHHLCLSAVPKAVAVINPNRFDEKSEYKYLAGVGVTFLLIVAVNNLLRKAGFYEDKKEPNLLGFLDFVALGTVCDVVPLVGLNRAFVAQGIKIMSRGQNIGINALANIAAINDKISPYHLGFIIGPRINAGGRVGQANLGANLLCANDNLVAREIAEQLDKFNQERKAIELLALEEAIEQVENENLQKDAVIIVAKDAWHPGVIGIVAARIKEKYNRPTAVIALDNGVGKASARSINGIDFGSQISAAKAENIIIDGGGHAAAAGFSIDQENIGKLREFLNERLAKEIEQILANQIRYVDERLTVGSLNIELLKSFDLLEPFGQSNPEPRFMIDSCYVVKIDVLKEKHLRLILSEKAGGFTSRSLTALCWNVVDSDMGKILLSSIGKKLKFIGSAKINSWNDRESVQFFIEDIII